MDNALGKVTQKRISLWDQVTYAHAHTLTHSLHVQLLPPTHRFCRQM